MKTKGNQSLLLIMILAFAMVSCNQSETTIPVRKNIEDAVFASGHVEQENNYTVSSKVEGILLSFPVQEGDSVKKNDLIAIIENDVQNNQLQDAIAVYEDAANNASTNSLQLQQIQAQIDQAHQQLEFDKANYSRYKALWERKSASKLEFEKAELQFQASQNHLSGLEKNYTEVQNALKLSEERSLVQVRTQSSLLGDYMLKTEVSGQVIQVFKKQGELVRRGEAVARIGSGEYLIKLFVSEDDITRIDLGQEVAVQINTYPNKSFRAVISKIYPAFDEAEQSYIVEAQFTELPEKMFSGTQLQANIETDSRTDVLVIPTEFVVKGSYVILKNGEEKQIVTGSKNGTWTEVISGISEGDVIVKPQ